jgi:hypothetical protein
MNTLKKPIVVMLAAVPMTFAAFTARAGILIECRPSPGQLNDI